MKKKISLISNYNLEPFERIINIKSENYKCQKYNYGTIDLQLKKVESDYVFIVFDASSIFYEVKKFEENYSAKFNYNKLNIELQNFCKKLTFFSKKNFIYLSNFLKYKQDPFASSNFLNGRNSIKHILNYINNYLSENLSSNSNINIIDLNDYINEFDGKYHDLDFYIATKSFFTLEFYEFFLKKFEKLLNSKNFISKKLLLLDLDDTLWGGTVGEIGYEKLNIGGNDIYGESFQNFQKNILFLKKQGVQLGLVSKNEEKVALNAIRKHPEMILKEKDFSIIKINWNRKSENILNISKEINLNLDSFVFFDNDIHEREEVKENLPSVLVPDLSAGPLYYSKILSELNCFENQFTTNEDKNRTKYYKENFKRDKLLNKIKNKNEWRKQLKIKINIEDVNKSTIERTIQLLNKTNQMNMKTNIYKENEFIKKYLDKNSRGNIYVAKVKDKFGTYGLTGIISYIENKINYEIEDFVLSCRVMGRGVEDKLIERVKKEAIKVNKNIIFKYIKTKKNKPMLDYLKNYKKLKKLKNNVFQLEKSN